MSRKSKVALAFVLLFGSVSAVMAAPKHVVHRQLPAASYQTYGQAAPSGDVGFRVEHGQVRQIQGETGAVLIQDRDWAEQNNVAPENIW